MFTIACLALDSILILIQKHPVHTSMNYLSMINFNSTLPSTATYSKKSLPFLLSGQNFPHISWSPQYAVFYSLLLLPLLGPNILSTIFPNTLNFSSSLRVSDQIQKTTRKITVLHILMFTVVDIIYEYKTFLTKLCQVFFRFKLLSTSL